MVVFLSVELDDGGVVFVQHAIIIFCYLPARLCEIDLAWSDVDRSYHQHYIDEDTHREVENERSFQPALDPDRFLSVAVQGIN